MEDRYINPFSKASETYAQKLDTATIAVDHSQIEILLSEIENILPNLDLASQACLYYSIGTVYSDFAKYKGLTFEESMRKQLYSFRKA